MNLLLVEDNEKLRASMRTSLVRDLPGVDNIYECNDGAEAVQMYRTLQPDWVLMDIQLHSLDGLKSTRRIVDAFPRAKVIIVTQYDEPEYRDAAREAGARAYVLKENFGEVRMILAAHADGDR